MIDAELTALLREPVMMVFAALQLWGACGVFTSAAVLGLTDVDALTVSMAREVARAASPVVAATAIAIGVLANTAMKLGVALFFGSRGFRMIAGAALALMLVVLAATLMFQLL